jgi:hypothetical protein
MIVCTYCLRPFFDGELISIQLVNHTEYPYHASCLNTQMENENLLRRIFDEDGPVRVDTIIVRTFKISQVDGGADGAG